GNYSVVVANSAGSVTSGVALLTVTPIPTAVVYDLSSDFSATVNPTGPWSYGWVSNFNGVFNLLTFEKNFSSDNGVPLADWQVTDVLQPSVVRNMGSTTAISAGGA